MNKLGWFLLVLILIAVGGFVVLQGEVGERAETEAKPVPPVPVVSGDLAIPVAGVLAAQLADTWGDSRGGGERRHDAIDIMAPRGTLVVAAAPGRIEKLFESVQGGRTIYVRSPDQSVVHYYAHLDSYREGLAEGQSVRTGDVIGTVGFSGNANPQGPHLHFEVKRMRPGESWHQGEPTNPYPLLAGKASAR